MIVNWMAYAALCAALFGLAAASVDRLFAGRRRARRGVWITAIAASILVPIALPILSTIARTPVAPTPVTAVHDAGLSVAPASISADVVVLGIWGAASFIFAISLLVAHRRTTLALRRCRAGTIGGRAAFVSQDFGPAVVGLLRHHIVVPAWTLVLDEAEQELVVAHELEHARSGDPLLALAGVCAVVAMPWNVALWWQLARLRLAIELDCDARVIARRDHDALRYTRLLLAVGERVRGARHPVLAMSRSRSALAKRFDALLRRDVINPRRASGLVVLAASTLASVAFVPAPSVSEIVNLVRPPRAEGVVVAPLAAEPAGVSTASTAGVAPAARSTATIAQRAPRATSARRKTPAANVDVNTLPPVSVVPPAAHRTTLDSVVVARAAVLPSMRPAGGVITAMPSGARGRGGRGGFMARPGTNGADSGAVIARSGGRAGLVTRADTLLATRRDTIRPPS